MTSGAKVQYVEFHARSAFSFLEGASSPEDLIRTCADKEMPAMALLDRDGLYGAPRFHLQARGLGLKAHIGAEVTLANSRIVNSRIANSRIINSPTKGTPRNIRYPLLVQSKVGYHNLCRLITRYKLREKEKGAGFSFPEEVAEHSQGLICLTGGEEGPMAAALQAGGLARARSEVEELVRIFGRENVYVELQRHHCREQECRNRAAVEIARQLKLPLLATNGVHYAKLQDRPLADVFTCLRHKRTLDQAGRLLHRNSECYLRGAAEMQRLFADLPEAVANTLDLSARIEFTLEKLGYEFPRYPVPEGEDEDSYLRQLIYQGARERYQPLTEPVTRQIEHEFAIISRLKLSGYFLIVWDIVRYCRDRSILAQGRGSAANSVVCYSLGITAADPIGMKLLFERFLTETRGEWPDIDIDLPSGSEREQVIQYVYQRYGRHGAAMTANVITYRQRSAAREAAKVLGIREEMAERVSGMLSSFEWKNPADTLEKHFRQAGLDLSHPLLKKYLDLCFAMLDLPRHLGQHSGGMIVCQGQLDSVVPLEPASMVDRTVCQWDKDDCAALGLIKIDLLGLGMLRAMKNSLDLIRVHYNQEIDIARLPKDDPQVYGALQKADTIGLFQVESRAQMSFLPRLFPQEFYDIVISVGSVRPGPIQGNMVHPLIKRKQGLEPVDYPHPLLQEPLERTYGVILFQEQALRALMLVAGFTAAEAEDARRAMSHRRSQELMKPIVQRARDGMERKNIPKAAQEKIVHAVESFLGYAFPESHSISFALLAYASAYLKCHYLGAFTAALLNSQPMGFYAPAVLVKDAQRHGLKVRPIDIARSEWECTLEREGEEMVLRIGFHYVRSMREEAAHAIVKARSTRAFANIADLTNRLPILKKKELENLAAVGACNSLNPEKLHRRDALWQVNKYGRPAGPLLRGISGEDDSFHLARMTEEERMIADFRVAGFSVGRHPMARKSAELAALGVKPAAEIKRRRHGDRVRAAGSVVARQRPGTASGLIFMTLEDHTGFCDVVIMPDLYEKHRIVVNRAPYLLVEGELQKVENAKHKGACVTSIKATHVAPLILEKMDVRSRDFH